MPSCSEEDDDTVIISVIVGSILLVGILCALAFSLYRKQNNKVKKGMAAEVH